MKPLIIVLFLLQIYNQSFSQEFPDLSFDLYENDNLNEEVTELTEELKISPIDINNADKNQLLSIPCLTIIQVENIVLHLEKFGDLIDIAELQVVPGFSEDIIRKISPYIVIGNRMTNQPFKTTFSSGEGHYLIFRAGKVLERKKGYLKLNESRPAYSGSPWTINGRYRNFSSNAYSIGFSFEKDAGEKFEMETGSQKYGFDFYSFHLAIFNRKIIKSFVLGDYTLHFGQGLVTGSGFLAGKSSASNRFIPRSDLGIRPSNSFRESGFFRGIATQIQLFPGQQFTFFASSRKTDAQILQDEGKIFFKASSTSGLHRTELELSRRNIQNEHNLGTVWSVTGFKGRLNAGITSLYTLLKYPAYADPDPVKYYSFSGRSYIVSSAYFTYIYHNFLLFGETGISEFKNKAIVIGTLVSLSPRLDYQIIYRNYSKGFHSFYANSFSEKKPNNEVGCYQSIIFRPLAKTEIIASYDIFKFPWVQHQIAGPSRGFESNISITKHLSKVTIFTVSWKTEEKEKNNSIPTVVKFPMPLRRSQILTSLNTATEFINYSTKVIFTDYRFNSISTGTAFIQDIGLDLKSFNLSARFALFDTDNYDSRIYIYEKDVLYFMQIPVLYGKGIRLALNASLKVFSDLDIWVKINRTQYFDRTSIGSGHEEISGNKRTEIRLQVRYSF